MRTLSLPCLSLLSPDQLTAKLYSLRAEERGLLVEFLAYLGELDRRRLYLEIGFSSTFAFCTDYLGLSRSSAFRRMTAARLIVRFPVVAEYLVDGRLGLTTLVELRDVLCEEKLGEILDRAAGRTEEEVKVLVAALQPRAPLPDLLRRLPERGPSQPTLPLTLPGSGAESAPRSPEKKPPVIAPISEELRVLRMTVGREFVADLEKVRSVLSHQIPDQILEKVLHECIRRTLRECGHRKSGGARRRTTPAPAGAGAPAKQNRYIPAAVRAEVWRRDDGSCAFVAGDGRRCGSAYQVEFHHVEPFAKGGPSTVTGIALRCRAHNYYEAEKEFGQDHMMQAVAIARQSEVDIS